MHVHISTNNYISIYKFVQVLHTLTCVQSIDGSLLLHGNRCFVGICLFFLFEMMTYMYMCMCKGFPWDHFFCQVFHLQEILALSSCFFFLILQYQILIDKLHSILIM